MKPPFNAQLVAGDCWAWTVVDSGRDPGTGVTLKCFLRGASRLDLVAEAAGAGFVFTAAASDTAALTAGTYAWQIVAVDASGARTELGRGTVEVLPNIEDAAAGCDGRSWIKVALDNVRKVLEGNASREESEYQINGRMLKSRSARELIELEGVLAARYRGEQIASGQLSPRSNDVVAVFGPVGGSTGGWHA